MNSETTSCVFTPCQLCGGNGLQVMGADTLKVCPNGCLDKRFGKADFRDVFKPVIGYGWSEARGGYERNLDEAHLP